MKRLIFLLFPLTILSENIQFYEGPSDKSDDTFQSWWQTFQQVRDEAYNNLDLSIYDVEEIKWARTSFIQPQVMVHERSHICLNISENFTKRGSAGLITLGLVSVVLIAGIVGLIMGAKHFRYI